MAGKLDGAGTAKMETLAEAGNQLTRLHSIVERMALASTKGENTAHYLQQIKRNAPQLVGLLKGQFGLIADTLAALMLSATRGGSEKTRVRVLREGVASIRAQLDVAIRRVGEQHTQTAE